MLKNAKFATEDSTLSEVVDITTWFFKNVMLKNAKFAVWFITYHVEIRLMNFEKGNCQRCTRLCYVCVFGDVKFCDACLEAMIHNPETKTLMHTIMKQYGEQIPDLDKYG